MRARRATILLWVGALLLLVASGAALWIEWERAAPPATAQPEVTSARMGSFGLLVTISIGSADGVRAGDFYSIRRGGRFLGRLKIDTAVRDMAVGLWVDAGAAGRPGARPREGDTVHRD